MAGLTPSDALRIVRDLQQANHVDRHLKWRLFECQHRDEIIEKLQPLVRKAELVHDKK